MATMQKLILMVGKVFRDRQGNLYKLITVIPDGLGRPERIVVENESTGKRSQRLASGKVKAGSNTPRDILLKPAQRQRRASIDLPWYEDEEDIDFDEEDDTFYTSPSFNSRRGSRARYGSYVTPSSSNLDFLDEDDDNDLGLPSLKTSRSNGDVEITIKVKR